MASSSSSSQPRTQKRQQVEQPQQQQLLVWFQLVDDVDGKPYKGTQSTKVAVSASADVDDFRKAVKIEYADSHLQGIAPSNLLVYKNKAAFDEEKEEPLEEDSLLDDFGASKKEALIVVVPSMFCFDCFHIERM